MQRYIHKKGFTLVELLIVISILGILIVMAAPSFQQTIERRRLEGATEAVFNTLHFAKSEAIKQNQRIYVSYDDTDTADWCLGLDEDIDSGDLANTQCDCTDNNPVCEIDGITKIISADDYSGITLSANYTNDYTGFEPRNGMAIHSGTFVINSSTEQKDVIVSLIGRIRVD